MSVDVSIVVVNFNSVAYLSALLDTVRRQEFKTDGRPGTFEVVIIDNASRGEDSAVIEKFAEDPRVRFLQNLGNQGYALANNQGYHVARGRYHMILNPDTLLLPGCLQELVAHLEKNPDTAMVGPMAYMDPECTVMMPPNELPTPEWYGLQIDSQTEKDAALANLLRRTRFSYPYWMTNEPLEMEMLSGCCVMFRRELYDGTWPFDPGYPLYYEDTDMFMVLTKRQKKMMHIPSAKIVHYFSRSAYTHTKGAQFRHRLSENRYFKKHFGDDGFRKYEAAKAKLESHLASGEPPVEIFPFEEVRAASRPPEFYVDSKFKNYYGEMSGNPLFTLAAAFLPVGDGYFTLSQSMWDGLGCGTYWARTVDKDTKATQQAWIVHKVAAL